MCTCRERCQNIIFIHNAFNLNKCPSCLRTITINNNLEDHPLEDLLEHLYRRFTCPLCGFMTGIFYNRVTNEIQSYSPVTGHFCQMRREPNLFNRFVRLVHDTIMSEDDEDEEIDLPEFDDEEDEFFDEDEEEN